MDCHLDTAFLYPWLPRAVIIFQIGYVAIMWLVSNTKFHLEENESPIMLKLYRLADYPPLFALFKADNSSSKAYIVTFQKVNPVGWIKVQKFARARLLETNTAHMRHVNHNTIA